jgi:dihydroxyacetone kinase DhaKLM complex PTS-EIIA-like component DhaM
MMRYLMSKVDKFAEEACYYEIIGDVAREGQLAEITGLEPNDIGELREKVMQVRADLESVENKEFVFRDMQSLIGVYRVK